MENAFRPADEPPTEEIVDVFPGIQGIAGSFGTPRLYDVVFTDRRLVGVMKGSMPGFLEGAIYFATIARKARKSEVQYDLRQLDAALTEQSKSFSIPYATVQKAKLSGFIGARTLAIRAPGRELYLYFPKDYLDQLTGLLDRYMRQPKQ